MMRWLRRYVVVIALMFWQGGFTFYVSVVVPVGTEVLGSTVRQGFITRKVTVWLNVTGAVALGVLALDQLLCRDGSRRRRWARLALWVVMALAQALLFYLHAQLDGLMEERGRIVRDQGTFYTLHRVYLWTHTVQWGIGLVWVGLMLGAWRREDSEK